MILECLEDIGNNRIRSDIMKTDINNKLSKTRWSNIANISPVTKIIPNKKHKKKEKDILKENNTNVYRFD